MQARIQRIESKFQAKFHKWAAANMKLTAPAFWEFKHTRGKPSFPYRELYSHQKNWHRALMGIKPVFIKAPDLGPTFKAYDSVSGCYSDVFIPIQFNEFFVVIGAGVLADEIKRSDRKSLTEKRARQIAYLVVEKNLARYKK